jgi:hypothetical protein
VLKRTNELTRTNLELHTEFFRNHRRRSLPSVNGNACVRPASFDFLEFFIRMNLGLRTGKPYQHVCSSAKPLKKIKTMLTQLTGGSGQER